MKKVASVLGLLSLGGLLVLVGCLDQPINSASRYQGPLFRYHFAGRAHLPAGTNAVVYKTIDALPQTAELRADVARKLALSALPFWSKDLAPGVTDQSTLLRPLFEDLLVAPALVEIRGPTGKTESVLAIELAEDKAQTWNANLRQLATAWRLGTPREVTVEGAKGWEVQRTQAPTTLQFFRVGQWVLVGLGQEPQKALAPLLSEARRHGRPLPALRQNFLELSVDFPSLRAWFPILGQYPLPAAVASLAGRGQDVRTEVRFHYRSRIPWKFEPWRIPTNFVGEPLTSFTAIQGVAPLLQAVRGSRDLGVNPLPNQLYSWGVRHPQCRMYFGIPVADSYQAMNDLSAKLPQFITATVENARGDFLYTSNRYHLVWGYLQHIVPVLYAERQGRDHFLVGGNVPLPRINDPAPSGLFAQLQGRTNLVYYDWEITQERLTHGKQFWQLACFATGRSLPATNTPVKKWIAEITPRLTNSATEITYVGPQELALVRKSHLGLTGFEIATLSTWIDSPGFPWKFSLPPIMPWTRGDRGGPGGTNVPPGQINPGKAPAPVANPPLQPKPPANAKPPSAQAPNPKPAPVSPGR